VNLRAIVVDDEELARERVRSFLTRYSDMVVICECSSGAEAIAAVNRERPDVLFLDVQMPGIDGFGVLEAIAPEDRPPAVVFTTAYELFARSAFDVNAVDYLLKPFSRERFDEAVRRARDRLAHKESMPVAARLAVRTGDATELVPIGAIDWAEAEGNYVRLHSGAQSPLLRETIVRLEERLAAHGFARIHRSIIVNLNRVVRVEPWSHGEYVLVLRDGTKLKSGRNYGERVRQLITR
jgi:two-component system LytT family response regulator